MDVIALLALIVALAALAVAAVALSRANAARKEPGARAVVVAPQQDPEPEADQTPPGPAALIFNPVKRTDWEEVREHLARTSREVGLPEPLFFETTKDSPGTEQARQAVAAGASVVIAGGGDGTVRAVAAALTGTGVPMALLPSGTGNLLARNLELPLAEMRDLINIALTGRDTTLDAGWVRADVVSDDGAPDAAASARDHIFLVISGVGLDASMIADTDEELKSKIGWLAYGFGAAKHLVGHRIHASMTVGEAPEAAQLNARTIMFANCGKLPVGVMLLPDAQYDDGWLDAVAIDTRGGMVGWMSATGKILMRGLGLRGEAELASTIAYKRGRRFRIATAQPEPVQVDGDLVGQATGLDVWVEPGALLVRRA